MAFIARNILSVCEKLNQKSIVEEYFLLDHNHTVREQKIFDINVVKILTYYIIV